jgi:ABC-type transporter Mla subunit MlaD
MLMKRERNALWAGIFIIVSIALIIGVIIAIKGVSRFAEPLATHRASFRLADDIGGLRVGDEVRVGGLKVGVVRDIQLVSPADQQPHILITFTLPRRIELRDDAAVSVQSTVTGTSNLNIESLGRGQPLTEGQTLAGSPSTLTTLLAGISALTPEITGTVRDIRTTTVPKVNDALDKAAATAVAFNKTANDASALIEQIRQSIDPILARYYGVADAAGGAMGEVRDLLGDTKGDLRSTISSIAGLSGDLEQKIPPILDRMDALMADAQTSVRDINVALDDVKKIAANTRDVTASARSLITGNQSRFERMILSLRTTADNLKGASAEIRRSPWRLLYRPKPGEMANLNLFDSARQFAEGASDLNDAAAALRDAMHNPEVEAAQLQPLVERLDKTFERFEQVEQELWRGVRE